MVEVKNRAFGQRMYQQASQYLLTSGTPSKMGIPKVSQNNKKLHSALIDWSHQFHAAETRIIFIFIIFLTKNLKILSQK